MTRAITVIAEAAAKAAGKKGAEKTAEEAAEQAAKAGGKKAAKDTAKKGDKPKGKAKGDKETPSKGEKLAATAKAEEKGVLSRNKGKIAGVGALAAAGYALTRNGGSEPLSSEELQDTAKRIGGTLSTSTASVFGGTDTGEIELDPEIMAEFIAALRSHASSLQSASKGMPAAIDHVKAKLSVDGAGTPTQDGKPAPITADFADALDACLRCYNGVVSGIIQQLTGDASRLERIVNAHMDVQETNAAKINDADTALV